MSRIKFAFLGAGGIAVKMADTAMHMPDIELYAVAARDRDRAAAFAEKWGFNRSFGSYEEMLRDPEVQLVYIATPHSHHYEHAMLCLEHGKHVLCEKAFTANAEQAEKLIAFAREKNLLITEAIWTRYMPLSKTISELIAAGTIGTVTSLTANLGYKIAHKERITDPALAGGALLDLTVYPLNFASMVLGDRVKSVSGTAVMAHTGVDAMDSVTLCYESGEMAVLTSTIYSQTDRLGIIYGDQGHLVVENINNPERVSVVSLDREVTAVYEAPKQISGYEYEVEAAVRAIREGRIECPEMPHSETLRLMKLMDGLRRDWGIRFPFE